jgi:predicted RNase H-like HicB family nuclease
MRVVDKKPLLGRFPKGGSGCYALMATREEALAELSHVFDMIAQEYQERGTPLPEDTTEIVNA